MKNARAIGNKKEQPLFPESYEALINLKDGFQRIGLIFSDKGKIFGYRQIQSAYNTAFKRAGLPYTSTHIMRHGGCSMIFNQTGDLTIAQQHLGNSSLDTTQIYAHRNAQALNQVVKKLWLNYEHGRKWSQK